MLNTDLILRTTSKLAGMFLCILGLLCALNSQGQSIENPNTVRIYGKVKAENYKGVVIYVVYLKDSIRLNLDSSYYFSRDIKRESNMSLTISSESPKTQRKFPIHITAGESEVFMGTLDISADVKEIKSVEILGQRFILKQNAEKTVFSLNAKEFTGDNLTDALVKIPGFQFSGKKITYNNQGFGVYIDGKLAKTNDLQSLLNGLQSLNVQNIEVINPSSKNQGYVLNINLKNLTDGYSISPTASFSTGKYAQSSFFNYMQLKKGKISSSLTTAFGIENQFGTSIENRAGNVYSLHNNAEGLDRKKAFNYNFDLDYSISNNTIIGINSYTSFSKNTGTQNNSFSKNYTTSDSTFLNDGHSFSRATYLSNTLYFRHQLNAIGDEIAISLIYNYSNGGNKSRYVYQLTNPLDPTYLDEESFSSNRSHTNVPVINLNYLVLFPNKKGKIETGLQCAWTHRNEEYFYNTGGAFDYQESNVSMFSNLNYNLTNTSFQVGLRAESFRNNSLNQPYLYLLPSFSYQRKVFKNISVNIRYNKRAIRPNFSSFSPGTTVINPFENSTGNPEIKLSKIDELSFTVNWKSIFVSNSLGFLKHGTATVPDFDSNNEVITNSLINLKRQFYNNLNISYRVIFKNIGFFPSASLSTQRYVEENNEVKSNNSLSFRLSSTYTLTKSSKIDLSYYFIPTSNGLVNQIKNKQRLDIAYKYSFYKNSFNLKAGIEDIFNTATEHGFSSYGNYYNEFDRAFDTRRVVLSLSYNFRYGKPVRISNKTSSNFENRNRIIN